MNCDVNMVMNDQQKIEHVLIELKKAMDCEWSDAVHESFKCFIEEFTSYKRHLDYGYQGVQTVAADLRTIDIDSLEKSIKSLVNAVRKEEKNG